MVRAAGLRKLLQQGDVRPPVLPHSKQDLCILPVLTICCYLSENHSSGLNYCQIWLFRERHLNLREGLNEKKTFSFGHCPNFLALFLEVHFWSIKRVYFFKNANVLNFSLFFRLFIYLPPIPTFLQTFFFCESSLK